MIFLTFRAVELATKMPSQERQIKPAPRLASGAIDLAEISTRIGTLYHGPDPLPPGSA